MHHSKVYTHIQREGGLHLHILPFYGENYPFYVEKYPFKSSKWKSFLF